MPYNLHFSNTGTVFVPDMPPGINEIDTSLSLVGRGYPNYGEKIAENFLHLLENFASPIPPVNPILGQLWYDTANPDNKVLRIMNGNRADIQWPSVTGIYQQDTDPQLENQSFKEGDIWVDTLNYQLNIYAGGEWAIVGPSESPNTGAFAATLSDNTNTDITYGAILNTVNNEVVSAIVDDEFTVFLENTHKYDLGNLPIPLKKGINLSRGSILNGTSASALGLKLSADGDPYPASNFLRKNNNSLDGELITGKVVYVTPSNQTQAVGRDGVVIRRYGNSNYIQLYKDASDAVILNDTPGGKIIFKVKGSTGGDLATSMYMEKSLVKINVTTEAVNSTTGALVVAGGVAIGGNLYLGKKLYVNSISLTTGTLALANTAVSTSTNTGVLTVAGGVGIGGRLNIGNTATIYSTAESISTTTGAVIVVGGVGIGGNLNVGRRIALDDNFYLTKDNATPILAFNPNSYISFNRVDTQLNFTIDSVGSMALNKTYVSLLGTATSISTTTGALIVAGGVGIGGSVNIEKTSTIAGARILTTATSSIVYPEDFGAKGNGTTNDSAALQAAIDTGKSVYLADGKTYYYTIGLILNNSYQRFGGPGVLKPSGSINGVTIGGGSEGVEVDLTFNAPDLAGCAVRVDNGNRVTIKKLHGVNIGLNNTFSSILYVQRCNTCVVEWMWARTGGKGITWYGTDDLRSDILRINFAILDCADNQYGLDWDGNCHSLEIGYLGLVGTKGAIIRNTYKDSNPGATTFPAIGRFNHIEIDYPTSHGIEITAGLDYDFNIPYILGAGVSTSSPGKSGIKISSTINSYQVRINGGKSIGNTGYGIENAGGVVYSDGTTDLSNNVLGRTTGTVWTTVERLTLDDDNFYLTMSDGNPHIVFGVNSYWVYDRTNKQLNLTIDAVGTLKVDKTYVQTYKPIVISDNTAASSTNTGALRVAGGVGIGGNLYIGGSLYVNGVLTSGSGTSLPAQTGNSGKYLTTDGSTLSWGTPASGTSLPSDATGYLYNNGSGTLSWGTPAGSSNSRTSVETTTISLADGESATAEPAAARGYALYSIQVSAGAWVTIYSSAAARSADSSRLITEDPLPGSGVIAEAISTSATTTYFTPAVIGFNVDPSPSSKNAYLKIANNSGVTRSITVTLTYLPLEN